MATSQKTPVKGKKTLSFKKPATAAPQAKAKPQIKAKPAPKKVVTNPAPKAPKPAPKSAKPADPATKSSKGKPKVKVPNSDFARRPRWGANGEAHRTSISLSEKIYQALHTAASERKLTFSHFLERVLCKIAQKYDPTIQGFGKE